MFRIKRKIFLLTAAFAAVSLLSGCEEEAASVNIYQHSSAAVISSEVPAVSSRDGVSEPPVLPASSASVYSEPVSSSDAVVSSSVPESSSLPPEPSEPPEPGEPAEYSQTIYYNCDPDHPVTLTFTKDAITVSGKYSDVFTDAYLDAPRGTASVENDGDVYTYTLIPDLSLAAKSYGMLYIKDKNNYKNYVQYEFTSEGLRPAYVPEILQGNSDALDSVTELSEGQVLQYITLDGKITRAESVLDEVKKISDEICAGITDDYEKIRAIAFWASEKIYYDRPAYSKGIPQECLTLEYVLNNRSSVCGGFANMVSALCAAQGIRCVNVKGLGLINGECFLLGYTGWTHEWNVAEADGRYIYIDSVWNSHNEFRMNKTYGAGNVQFNYFDMGAEAFAIAHKALSAEHRDYFAVLG